MSSEERKGEGLHLALVSVHGLIRGHDLELGRDADTGGQTLYVVEVARALAARDDVAQVDLITRRVVDPKVSDDYARREERLADGARIVRLDCGPQEYIRKEQLWDHLDAFADEMIVFYNTERRHPDLIHSHYADAGYVGVRTASQLGVPLVHTGHSLGRVKRRRLLASGLSAKEIEERYNMARRIEAEEETLASAEGVVASTTNEVEEQYALYDDYRPSRMRVIPPGTDIDRFRPPAEGEEVPAFRDELARFLREPDKPIVLAVARPDERKNLRSLVEAYGGSRELRELANLVVVAGNRDDISELDDSAALVLTDLLVLIDAHDLYGRVAYPKHHGSDDIPGLYRLTASSRGVFVNPALTEPFGLTLIEAAASGVPIVATEDGGPRDIVENCRNGHLIDPLDLEAMAATILEVLQDPEEWDALSARGLEGVRAHYSWQAHAQSYVEAIRPVVESAPKPVRSQRGRLRYADRALFSDLDQNLLGDRDSLRRFVETMRRHRKRSTFGIATGRRLDSALKALREYGIPRPDVLISSVGTEIHYGPTMSADKAWRRHIDHLWNRTALNELLADLPGLELQGRSKQSRFKISYFYDAEKAPSQENLLRLLRQNDLPANLFIAFGQYLDIVPVRASKGFAVRWFADHWQVPLDRVLAAGGSGTDEDMMRGNTLAAVVANRHDEELSKLVDVDRIYFAREAHAEGILEAIEHYDFFGECRVPEDG